MSFRILAIWAPIILSLLFGCGKKKFGDVSASLMKSKTVSAALISEPRTASLVSSGSLEQSFTPATLKIPIFRVSVCEGYSECKSIYTCEANTVQGCGVELSKIDAFTETLASGSAELEEGKTYDHVSVQFCADGDSSSIQNITLNGTVKVQGIDYATDPTAGLVEGTSGKDTSIKVKGGCASFYAVSPAVTISKDTPIKVRLFFDASLYAYGGFAGEGGNMATYSSGACAGSTSAYVCAPVITVVGTIDSGTPTVEHYMIANIDSSANNAPTAKVALYFSSDGTPIGGVQNSYRLSGTSVSWGTRVGGGLALMPKKIDADTVSFGEPEGSISLADWFKSFKRSTHTGTYTYSTYGGGSAEGTYKATRL